MRCWDGCNALIIRGKDKGRVVRCLAFVGTKKNCPLKDLWRISSEITWVSKFFSVTTEHRQALCPDSYMMPIPDGDPDLVTERTKELVTTED